MEKYTLSKKLSETARALGFKEACDWAYIDGFGGSMLLRTMQLPLAPKNQVNAPYRFQVQDWLREHGMNIAIHAAWFNSGYYASIPHMVFGNHHTDTKPSYDEVLEDAILYCFKCISNTLKTEEQNTAMFRNPDKEFFSKEDMKEAFDSAREFNSQDGVVDIHVVVGFEKSDLYPVHDTFEDYLESLKK
jgi:hypothetical protein